MCGREGIACGDLYRGRKESGGGGPGGGKCKEKGLFGTGIMI